jgi:imidazoleglycerol-phosphate dehydratase
MTEERVGQIIRKTGETEIKLELMLDGDGSYNIDTGVPFLDHMLTLFAVHGFFNLNITAKGDTEVDDHHTVEDIGICLGQALSKALADKKGIARYGCCYLPMDETLVRAVVDLSNRPYLHFQVPISEQKVGTFDTQLAKEFMRGFSQHGGITMHIDLLHGENGHHIIEAVFKGVSRAISDATRPLSGFDKALSSKGSL